MLITQNFPKGIRPDIIVHKRTGNYDDNLLAIEFKMHPNKHGEDRGTQKLKDLTSESGQYRYKLGIFIRIKKESFDFIFIKKRREIKWINNTPIEDLENIHLM